MRITRRTLLVGAGTGAAAMLLASCTGGQRPSPSPTGSATPTATPSATTMTPTPSPALPRPERWLRSEWTSDPFSRGAVSFVPVGATPQQRAALAAPLEGRVFFAGEATASDRPGSVLGAYDSGARAAAEVLGRAVEGERMAVIGAGAAGATVARSLADAGFDVTVFEARDRVGGRIHSVPDDAWPVPLQLGAWTLGEDDAAFLGRLRLLGVEELDLEPAIGWSESGETAAPGFDAVRQAADRAADQPADSSLADALDEAGADVEDPALEASLAWLAATTGADPGAASSWFPPAIPPETLVGAAGDLSGLVESPLTDIQVTLSSPVVRIAYDERGVSLRIATGEALSFDRVVVTVPLGVLQSESIEFAPALPTAHRGALAALGMGTIETAWLRFEERFWSTDAVIWHVVGGDALIRTWFNLEPVTGEPVLVGLVGGGAAAEFAALDDDEAVTAALASLAFFARE
ncbi:FAD-dependent oxidoreductase [Microbacterium oryzae]|uniref:flavin monoamine oxidase family protein n=1 Tax=Microbacterium oryzae TaxID=743009 RepID=UPI0025AF299B|nr:FAD-dependent oxidoreductase [Microbacterium oryzae]MDN3310912.1 FAD-dependent oxidoreductase [Microbacterium oryzae]